MTAHIVVPRAGRRAGHDEPRAPPRPASHELGFDGMVDHGRARDEGDQRDGRRREGASGRSPPAPTRSVSATISSTSPSSRCGDALVEAVRSKRLPEERLVSAASRASPRLPRRRLGRRSASIARPGAPPPAARCGSTATRGSTARCWSWSSSPRSGWLRAGFRSSPASGSARPCPRPSCERSTRAPSTPASCATARPRRHRARRPPPRMGARRDRRADGASGGCDRRRDRSPGLASGLVGDVCRDVRSGPRERGSCRRGAILGLATRGGAVR